MSAAETPSLKNQQEITLTVKLRLSKPLTELTDLVGGRLWMMDGIEDVTVSVEPTEVRELSPAVTFTFEDKIREFNKMYGLPVQEVPGMCPGMGRMGFIHRMEQLLEILKGELNECYDIIYAAKDLPEGHRYDEILTMLADWLGDIQVYCASEMRKFGMSNDMILSIIMASNMSKLGADGKPIIESGKVQKGPNYWKPEPLIRRYIEAAQRQAEKENRNG